MTVAQARETVRARYPEAKAGRTLKVETGKRFWFISNVGRNLPGFPTEDEAWRAVAEWVKETSR